MNERRNLAERLGDALALDVRSLAAFRIAIGVLLLADLANRAVDFAAFSTDAGVAPVDLVRQRLAPGEWSFHLLGGSAVLPAALHGLATVLALALVAGYRTRLATIGSFLLLASLHIRLPIVLNAGDTLLRVMLFWAMFLPLGAAWSLDARRRGPPPSPTVASAATFAFLVQLALAYWCAGLSKLNADWLAGDALGEVFAFSLYSQPLGRWLAQFPELTKWLGRGVVALELLGPCLLFVPWRNALCRAAAVVAFAAFHMGIAATITVGLFPWVGLAAWLAVVPGTAALRSAAAGDRARLLPPFQGGGIETACVFAALALVVAWNAIDLAGRGAAPRLWTALRPVANATMLRQSWRLFSDPTQFDAWFFYRGRLANGDVVDLTTGEPFVDQTQPTAPQRFPSHRWRKLHLRLTDRDYAAYRQPLAEYVRRTWDAGHAADERVARLDLYCLRLPVHRRGQPDGFVRQNLAMIVVDPSQGNFADALRELGE